MTALRRWIAPVLVLMLFGAFLGRGFLLSGDYSARPGTAADPASAYTDGRPNLVAAMFYSAWCSSCAILEPRLQQAVPSFDGRAVEFAKFDFSLGQRPSLEADAEALGVAAVYAANKGATGFLALIDRRDQRVVDIVTIRDDDARIRARIEAAILAVSAPTAASPAA